MSELVQTGQFRLLESFETHIVEEYEDSKSVTGLAGVKTNIKTALEHFPELAEYTITVALTHENCSWRGEPYGMADPPNRLIYLNYESATTEYQTIFHELMHIALHIENTEHNADHPLTSEPYCSIKTIARMPPDLVYREHIAYLGTPGVPKDEYPEICQEALEYRENHRNYIQKAREWLEIND